jgi:hypothetical protein
MRLLHVGSSVVGAIAIVLATPVSIESARWWRSSRVVAELGLSAKQTAALDAIYQSMTAQSADCARNAATARRLLDDALMADGVDDVLEMATSRLADTEYMCRRTRTIMLYRMFRELSVEQRRALASIASRTSAYAQAKAP